LRVSLIFVVFEAGMPLIGPAAASGLACVIAIWRSAAASVSDSENALNKSPQLH
jgi:hypothetical protein